MQPLNLHTYDVHDGLDLLAEQKEYLANRSYADSSRPWSVAENYYAGNQVIAIHIGGRWGLKGERREFSAVCKIAAVPLDGGNKLAGEWDYEIEVPAFLPVDGYIQKPVLVTIVKIADDAEQGRNEIVRSVVRLYRLNNCPHCQAQRLNVPELPGKFRTVVSDGELKSPVIGRGIESRLMHCNGVDKMVKSGPKIMDTVTADQRQAVSIKNTAKVNDDTVMTKIGFSITGDRIRLYFLPSEDFFGDSVGVFVCTTDFKPTLR